MMLMTSSGLGLTPRFNKQAALLAARYVAIIYFRITISMREALQGSL